MGSEILPELRKKGGEQMTRKEAIKNLKELLKWYLEEELLSETVYKREAVDLAISALSENNGGWFPITYRPMTEDELKDYEGWIDYLHPEKTMILDCHLPDSGAEVLITSNGYVGIDTFYNEDGDCYFESANIDEVIAWRPLPEPYQEGEGADEKTDH